MDEPAKEYSKCPKCGRQLRQMLRFYVEVPAGWSDFTKLAFSDDDVKISNVYLGEPPIIYCPVHGTI